MESIKWGIIGCGDVTEVKSGPAFNKVPGSSLIAVMRRDAAKAKDYALRHAVPKWYDDAYQLINDPEVNAVYVATPPVFHEEFTIAALRAGKPVYVEKPMALNAAACERMQVASEQYNTRLSVAHYRRALPLFMKIKELLAEHAIGQLRFVDLRLWQPVASPILINLPVNWRVDPSLSGGGLFHDLAPHQLDLMFYYFGKPKSALGFSGNQAGVYQADDIVSGQILFDKGIIFTGLWCFTISPDMAKDQCEIVGSEGTLRFSFFAGTELMLIRKEKEDLFRFTNPAHVQQPLIEQVVNYFLDRGPNPCSAGDALEMMRIIDAFTKQ